jgi:lactose/L-arabinose transport system substrate-binding protein
MAWGETPVCLRLFGLVMFISGLGRSSIIGATLICCASFCGRAAGDGEPFAIDSSIPPANVSGAPVIWGWNIAAASLEKIIPAFNEIYPNVKAHVSPTGMNLQSRFLLSLSAGVGAPDISQLQLAEAVRYARTRKLTDLTPVAKKYENAFPSSFWDNCVFEGKIYAIPWDMGPCAIFYKRSILAKYQIDPDAIETWDDYIAAGKLLLERSGGKTKMFSLATGNMEGTFEILLQQVGGQMFDAQERVAINSPETAQVMQLLRKFLQAGITANLIPYSHPYYAAIPADYVATFLTAAWFGGTIKDYAPKLSGDWGVFRLPAMEPGGLRTSNQGGSVLVIPDQSKQKEAAWAFIEYALCSQAGQLAQYRNFDLFPALMSTHSDPFFDEPDPFYSDQKVRRLFSLDIEKIQPMNRTKDWFEALRYVQQALSKWVADGMGPEGPFLEQLEGKLCRRLGREAAPHAGGSGS